jgi:hypothetical protein
MGGALGAAAAAICAPSRFLRMTGVSGLHQDTELSGELPAICQQCLVKEPAVGPHRAWIAWRGFGGIGESGCAVPGCALA